MEGPVIISAAIFVSIVFLDLFRHEYKVIPVHAILGVFTVVLMSFLCETNRFLIAWVLLFIPFIILGLGIMVRSRNMLTIPSYPAEPIETKDTRGGPYFL
jgi:tetrahydromethanopterin S-methyltransferase subunit E